MTDCRPVRMPPLVSGVSFCISALTAFNVHSFCVIEIENQKRQVASRMFFCGIQPRSTISLEMQTEPSITIAVP